MNGAEISALAVFGVFVSGGWLSLARGRVRRLLSDRRVARHSRQAEAQAAEAAFYSDVFDPARIRSSVLEIMSAAQAAESPDRDRTAARPADSRLIDQWAQSRLEGDKIVKDVSVDLVRVLNRELGSEPTVDVRVRASVRRRTAGWIPGRGGRLDERWTLAFKSDHWALISSGPASLIAPVIGTAQVPTAAGDDERIRASALREVATADPALTDISGLFDPSAKPDSQLKELAAIDARFAPELIESALRQLVDAWERPTRLPSGSTQLSERATKQAVRQLLRPQTNYDRALMIVRDAALEDWKPISVRQADHRPTVKVELTVLARRFLVKRDVSQARMPGNTTQRRPITMEWTLHLDQHAPQLWRLCDSSNPAAQLPGAMP